MEGRKAFQRAGRAVSTAGLPAFMAYSSATSTALRELVDGEPSRVHRNG